MLRLRQVATAAALLCASATVIVVARAMSFPEPPAARADECPSYAWRDHDYARLRRCRIELTWADRIGHPLIWSDTLPDHSDVPGMNVPRGPAPEQSEVPTRSKVQRNRPSWLFAGIFNRSAYKAVREGKRRPGSPGIACTPLTLYTPFCREWISWSGGVFNEPELPGSGGHCPGGLTSSTVTTQTQFEQKLALGCQAITVNATGMMAQGGCTDCEVIIPAGKSIAFWFFSTNFPNNGSKKFSTRIRVRGPGQVGAVQFLPTSGTGSGTNSDIIFDGLQFTPNALGSGSAGPVFSVDGHTDRLFTLNSVLVTPSIGSAPNATGNGWFGEIADLGVFNCSASTNTSEAATNSWLWRNVGGSSRRIAADNMFRRFANQQAIAREGSGTSDRWLLRNNVLLSYDGLVIKDEDTTYDTSEVYLDHNTIVMSGPLSSNWAARPDQFASGGTSRKWVVTNTDWRSESSSNISASILQSRENACTNPMTPAQVCQYRTGNTYSYNASLASLTPAWPDRTSPLTGVTLDGDPTNLPGAL